MTSDQWVALIGQIGIGGLALVGMAYLFVKVVIPMASSKANDIVEALRTLTNEIKAMRAADHTEHAAITAALADASARISRIEAITDRAPATDPSNPRIRRTP